MFHPNFAKEKGEYQTAPRAMLTTTEHGDMIRVGHNKYYRANMSHDILIFGIMDGFP